ncbi:hypothetical protein T552_03453 [Pneumocystis carinii B80]|uniref:Dol-P-Glc:Glc(2)Man(9)GlcNAc(2)-PP-Dol alpha-1,2-glucosyltransferase n=1 Tax=Pneumocystis carinii (strain B80) TaxID=1408658 RepID=A0A0W4ZAU7_PNEC8|nr:hypothetical protein T552_03453 [Pneumocystis carinii B80]KTW25592.1 hypothetical protein T552_03453 [Pneumocystis carinii B80]
MVLKNLALQIEALRYQYAFSIQKHVLVPYMDEIFHVNQMKEYFQGNYLKWNDKITTPPGMYWIHLIILCAIPDVINRCDLSVFRMLNTITGSLCGLCFGKVITYFRQNESTEMDEVEGIILAQFPLLYFYSFLYYTDVMSTFVVFLSLFLALRKQYKTSAIVSFFSLTIRQTNIVWVLFLIGISVFPLNRSIKSSNQEFMVYDVPAYNANFFDYICFIKSLYRFLFQQYKQIIEVIWPYIIVVFLFGVFLLYNGGVVLGDKTNHTIMIHLPQLFYFSIFTAFWGSPYLLTNRTITHFFKWSFGSKLACFRTCVIIIIMELIIYYNTKEHPFLMSDNRHYTFYIWRRLIKVHPMAKYIAAPFYYASMWAVLNKLMFYHKISYILLFTIATTLVLGFVSLLEFRYFITPYLLWRFSIRSSHKLRLYAEVFLFLYINYITTNIFLYKPFIWESEPGSLQRFMW